MFTKNLSVEARKFARIAHAHITLTTASGDVRPQIEHLQEVADLVWVAGGTEIEIASAWLHDIIEDTETQIEDIEDTFGKEVSSIIYGLTDSKELNSLPELERKQKQAERVSTENDSVKKIKLADQISNVHLRITDPAHNWSFDNNRNYILGAKLIADKCRGINPLLDTMFMTEYTKAVAIFNI